MRPLVVVAVALAGPVTAADPPAVRSLSFSADGALLAAAVMANGEDGQVVIWDTTSRKLVARADSVGPGPSAAFAPDGKEIVVATRQKALAVLDARTGRKTGEIGPLRAEAYQLAAAGSRRWVARGKDNTFCLWDEKAGQVVHEFVGGQEVWGWAVSPDGKWLVITGVRADRLWDLVTGKPVVAPVQPQSARANAPAFLGEDRLLLGSNRVGSHRLIELPSGRELLFRNEGGTAAMAYSPAAGVLACRDHPATAVALTPLSFRPPRRPGSRSS